MAGLLMPYVLVAFQFFYGRQRGSLLPDFDGTWELLNPTKEKTMIRYSFVVFQIVMS